VLVSDQDRYEYHTYYKKNPLAKLPLEEVARLVHYEDGSVIGDIVLHRGDKKFLEARLALGK
jgi:hypothetical protein